MNPTHITYWFAGLWASAIVLCIIMGMAHHAQYHSLMAASAIGLVWCILQYHNTKRCRAIDYVILGACVLLGVGSYSGIKDVVVMPDVAGIIWAISGFSALVMTTILTIRSPTPHTNGMLQT